MLPYEMGPAPTQAAEREKQVQGGIERDKKDIESKEVIQTQVIPTRAVSPWEGHSLSVKSKNVSILQRCHYLGGN